jgi:hypothetical protein
MVSPQEKREMTMMNLNDELSMEQLDIAAGGKPGDGDHTGPHTGHGDGLGWLRKIVGAVKGFLGL